MTSETADAAVRKITRSPAMLNEARDRLTLVTRIVGPLSREQVYACLQPALILWGPPDHGEGPAAAAADRLWLETYTRAFRNLPREALEYAVDAWIMKGKPYTFPKPADLVSLGENRASELRKMAWRLRRAVEAVPDTKPKELTEEEREAAKAKIAEATRKLGARGMRVMSATAMNSGRIEGLRRMADRA